jgi:hypothetical protein
MAGAGRVVHASMPGGQGEAMMPFLARLPSLSYADRALAVHLGHFPADGRTAAPSAYAENTASLPDYGARRGSAPSPTDAGRPDPAQQLLQRRIAGAQSPEPSAPAPARSAPASTAKPAAKPRTERDLAPPVSAWTWSRGIEPARLRPVERPEQRGVAVQSKPAVRPSPPPVRRPDSPPAEAASPPPAEARAPVVIARMDANVLTPGRAASPPEPAPGQAPASPAAVDLRRSTRLADLAATVAGIADPPPAPTRRDAAAATPSARRPRTAEAVEAKPGGGKVRGSETADAKPGRGAAAAPGKPAAAPAKKPAPVREPSRVWVQVAGGADRAALPHEFDRLKTKAPKLLGGRSAWAAKLNATNRLLVGPFADAESAQDFVNALRKADLTAFAWTSEAGEKVEKLPAK